MSISVIIRCKNEEQWIGHTVQSVLDHLSDPEIIMIDNESNDDSRDVIRMFEHHSDIKRISIDNYSPGAAINLGAKEVKYEYILLLSAHCVIVDFNLSKHLQDLEQYCVVFGKQIPYYRGRRIGQRYLWGNFSDKEAINMFSKGENRYFLHNAFALYKTEILLEHPFDEKLYGKEDRYWANDMIKKHYYQILYDPVMKCRHHWTPDGATWKGIG